jgi:hypothetical protein
LAIVTSPSLLERTFANEVETENTKKIKVKIVIEDSNFFITVSLYCI